MISWGGSVEKPCTDGEVSVGQAQEQERARWRIRKQQSKRSSRAPRTALTVTTKAWLSAIGVMALAKRNVGIVMAEHTRVIFAMARAEWMFMASGLFANGAKAQRAKRVCFVLAAGSSRAVGVEAREKSHVISAPAKRCGAPSLTRRIFV